MKSLRWLVAVMALAALGACGDSGGADVKTASATWTGDAITGLPAEMDAGIYEVTLINETDEEVEVEFLERGDADPEQFFADFAVVLEGGPVPDYVQNVVGLGAAPANGSATSTIALLPGNYFVANTVTDDPSAVFTAVTVTGEAPDVEDLPDGATIRAFDYSFELDGLAAGTQTVTFMNTGPSEVHHAVIMGFPVGVDEGAAADAIATMFSLEEDEAPPEGTPEPEEIGWSGIFSAETGGTFELTLESGRTYGVFCFISDRAGSAPHAMAYEMMEFFTAA